MMNVRNILWQDVYDALNNQGYAVLKNVLSIAECIAIRGQYDQHHLYRSVIDMARYRFGKGEYKYFAYPLPDTIQSLRQQLYGQLAIVANHWMQYLSIEITYPAHHEEFLALCHKNGQQRPTPLILKYNAGGYNTLHQDLYGDVYFPFQVVIALSTPEMEYSGGECVMIEQIPRAQSKAQVISVAQGDGIIFTTNFRPVKGSKGYYRSKMKHGVSEVKSGERYALGIIFHDAK